MKPRELMEKLRREFPLKDRQEKKRRVLRVLWKDLGGGYDGTTCMSASEDTITITINSSRPQSVQWDAVIHEYAHALDLDGWDSHGERWSKEYGKCYVYAEQFK